MFHLFNSLCYEIYSVLSSSLISFRFSNLLGTFSFNKIIISIFKRFRRNLPHCFVTFMFFINVLQFVFLWNISYILILYSKFYHFIVSGPWGTLIFVPYLLTILWRSISLNIWKHITLMSNWLNMSCGSTVIIFNRKNVNFL